MKGTIFFLLVSGFFAGCANNAGTDKRSAKEPAKAYYDYGVNAAEEDSTVTVLLRYKEGGADAAAVALPPQIRVLINGQPLLPDSTPRGGVFYEAAFPSTTVATIHQLEVDSAGKKTTIPIPFSPLVLNTDVPAQVRRRPLRLQLGGLPANNTTLSLVMVDTAVNSMGVNEEVATANGWLTITPAMLAKLQPGPINLEIQRQEILPLKTGGRLVINHSLRRQFTLTQ